MSKSLAVKYRPKTFDDVTEQGAIKIILTQQIESGEIRNAYLFCGGAGTGKTTCARIFANEINKGQGNPIEMDAASHNSVDDVREIGKMAQTGSMTSPYKVFIIDECHSLSNQAWQAFLKLLEEPPAKSIFIFCTTDPQKIPKTIISRVQRHQFQRISQQGIADRLGYILDEENITPYSEDALEYIAKIADGGMRDAITMMDECLAYSNELTVDNVLKALNLTDYTSYMGLAYDIMYAQDVDMIKIIDEVYASGVDIKQYIKSFMHFILDVNKYLILEEPGDKFKYTQLPATEDMKLWLKGWSYDKNISSFNTILRALVKLDADIKWSQSPKSEVEASLLLLMGDLL